MDNLRDTTTYEKSLTQNPIKWGGRRDCKHNDVKNTSMMVIHQQYTEGIKNLHSKTVRFLIKNHHQ